MTAIATATPAYGSPEWQADRRNYLGASDMPMACGVSEYGGPLDLVRRKLGLDEVEQTHTMLRGHLYESAILAEFGVLHPEIALQPAYTRSHPHADWLRATPDSIATDQFGPMIVEAKLVTPYLMHQYGESGSDKVPDDKLVQVQTQMMVWGFTRAVIIVNFGYETRVYYIPADEQTQAMIFEVGENLWHNFIAKGVLPEPSVGVDSYDSIQRTLRAKTEKLRVADAESEKLIEEFAALKARAKADEEREKELKALLAVAIGEDYGLETPNAGRVIWPESKGRTSVDTDGLIRHLNVPEDVIQSFTRIGAPYRTMRYYPPKKGKK